MDQILLDFIDDFYKTFQPPCPRQTKGDWLVSKVWSDHLRKWLDERFILTLEYSGRLDAALWLPLDHVDSRSCGPDIALEWEWDQNKVATQFPFGDFRKIFSIQAKCGLAIIQTRSDRTRGPAQADNTIKQLRECFEKYCCDTRSIVVIENRRVVCSKERVEFRSILHDFSMLSSEEKAYWEFP